MANALRSLLIEFGIDVDDRKLKEAHKEAGGFKETLLKLGEAFGVAFGLEKLKEFVGGTIEAGARVKDLSERLGVGTSDLQAFQFAAGQVGVDAEGAAMSLGFLNRSIGQAVTGIGGGQVAQIFGRLGIALKDSAGHAREVSPVLNDLADAFAKLPDQQTRATYAMQLFGRQGQQLLPLLSDGSEGIAKMRAEFEELGGGMSDDFIKHAKALEDEQKKLSLSWTGLKSTVVGTLIPVLQPIVDWLKKIVVGATDLVKHTNVLQTAFKFATGLAVVLGLTKIAMAMRAIFVNGLLAEAPLLVIAAAVALLYLGFDELYTLLQGGDTLIGQALGPDKQKFVDDLRAAVDEAKASFNEFGVAIGSDGTSMDTFKTIVVDTAKALAWLLDLMNAVIEGGKKIGGGVGELIFGTGKSQTESDEEGLTPETKAKLAALRAGGGNKLTESYAATEFGGERDIIQQIRARRAAQASLPGPAGPNASTIPAYQPGGQLFQGPVYIPGAGGAGGARGGEAGKTDVHNEFKTQIDVHTSSDEPKKVGDAVGSAVATEQQRAHAKAYAAVRKP